MNIKIENAPLAASHPDYPVMSSEDLLLHVSKIIQAIEQCGASIELTAAVTLASDLSFHLRRYYLDTAASQVTTDHLTAENGRLRAGVNADMAEVERLQGMYDKEFRKARELKAEIERLKGRQEALQDRHTIKEMVKV